MSDDPEHLLAQARSGDRRSLARLLSMTEHGEPDVRRLEAVISSSRTPIRTIGVTGPPGAGKSTLVDALVARARTHDDSVAVLAVDPSSPIGGGAVLGDRIRMQRHAGDEGVFVRSFGTRGSPGGLTLSVQQALRVLEAVHRHSLALVETAGVGQVELDVTMACETVVVVVPPEAGDAVQTMKAGLFEVADVFAVNKADRPGAADTARDLQSMLDLATNERWRPPVVLVTAFTGDGVDELADAMERHRMHIAESGEDALRRRHGLSFEVSARVFARLRNDLANSRDAQEILDQLAAGKIEVFQATDALRAVVSKLQP